MKLCWNYQRSILQHFISTNFNWISFGISLPCPALHQLLALISELKNGPTKNGQLINLQLQQVTSDQNTPVSLAGSKILSFCCFLKRSGFQGPCVHTLVQLAFFLGSFRPIASQSPTTRQFRISAPMLGLRLSHSSGSGSGEIWDFTQKSPTVWVGEMGRFPQPPAYQNGSVVVPQTPAVPKAMQGQAPYGGAEKKNLGGGLSFNFFLFSPPTWGRFPIWRSYFSDGLVQPPSRKQRWQDHRLEKAHPWCPCQMSEACIAWIS